MSFWGGFEKKAGRRPSGLTNQSLIADLESGYHKHASDPKEKVREDIRTYENQKKKRKLYGAGRMASLGLAGIGGFKKNPLMIAGGVGGSFGAGFMRGKAAKEEQAALNRIKRYYDLRDSGKLINLNAVIPGNEKTAIVADFVDLAISAINHGLHTHLPMVASKGPIAQLAVDALTLPWAAKRTVQGLKGIASIAVKKSQNIPISGTQNMLLGAADVAKGLSEASHALPATLYSKASDPSRSTFMRAFYGAANKVSKSSLGKYLTNLPADIFSTMSKGKKGGEVAGEILTQVGKVSPKYHALGIKAMDPGFGQARLVNQIKRDTKQLSNAWNTFSNETTIGKMIKRRGESSGTTLLTRYTENPELAMKDVKKIQNLENSIANAGKAVALAASAGVGGSILGEYRDRHPLSKNDLPTQIAKKREPGLTGSLFN